MVDVAVPSIATASPNDGDKVLGTTGGLVRNFPVGTGTGLAREVDLADPAKGSNMVAAPASGTVAQALPMVSVAQFGAVGAGNETAAFASAVDAAVAAGHRRVMIPFPAFEVTGGTDCDGCQVYGADTVLTGRLSNHAGLNNILVNGYNQSDNILSQSHTPDNVNKLLWSDTANRDYLFVQKPTTGYAMMAFERNITTSSDSLATSSTDPTRRRLTGVLNAVWCNVYKHTYSAVSGAWTEVTLSASTTTFANKIPTHTSGRALKYWRTSTQNDYIEFTANPINGQVNVALFGGTASEQSATITVNGVAYSVSGRGVASNTIKLYTFPAAVSDDASVTVRVTKNSANTDQLSVFGINFYELRDYVPGVEFDSLCYLRDSAIADYQTQNSANDAVLRDSVSGLYGLSYHGGESSIVTQWHLDGKALSEVVGQIKVGRRIELRTSCDVDWTAHGGGSIHIDANWKFHLGGFFHEASISGSLLASEVYVHMFGAREEFSLLTYPGRVDLTAAADGSRNNLGRTTKVIYENPTTGQRIISELALYTREQNRYGGVHVWKSVGSYHKLYYTPVLGGLKQITSLGVSSKYVFE